MTTEETNEETVLLEKLLTLIKYQRDDDIAEAKRLITSKQINPGIQGIHSGDTALMYVCHIGDVGMVIFLLETNECRPYVQNKIGFTALMYAVQRGVILK